MNYETVWKEFWVPILYEENGKLNLERLKEEMYDFYLSMSEIRKQKNKIKNDILDIPEIENESKELIKKYFEKEE
jgi:hypothetical protein